MLRKTHLLFVLVATVIHNGTVASTTRFQNVIKKNVENNANRILHHKILQLQQRTTNTRGHRNMLNNAICDMIDFVFDDNNNEGIQVQSRTFVNNPPDGQCSCDASSPGSISINCQYQNVCLPEELHQVGGKPICASNVYTNYTISINGSGGSVETDACVDMSNPNLPEYCIHFDFTITDANDLANVKLGTSCEASVDGEECKSCNIDISITDPESSCFNVDCSNKITEWPTSTSCQEFDTSSSGGGTIEASNFLMAFDDNNNENEEEDGVTSDAEMVLARRWWGSPLLAVITVVSILSM